MANRRSINSNTLPRWVYYHMHQIRLKIESFRRPAPVSASHPTNVISRPSFKGVSTSILARFSRSDETQRSPIKFEPKVNLYMGLDILLLREYVLQH